MRGMLDAASGFLDLLRKNPGAGPERLLSLWEGFYRERYPELFRLQVECHAREGLDWREIARERVFPDLSQRSPAMEAAAGALPGIWERVLGKAQEVPGFRGEVLGVMYVGVGCGAGWATAYPGGPAVLFGLEMIAELNWHGPHVLEGLAAHELGHVIHRAWRGEDLDPLEERPAGLLYTEGFAQRLEELIRGGRSFHQGEGASWVERCEERLPEIAREYLARLDGGDVRGFFGSWLDFRGIKYAGYFLGHRFILHLEAKYTLREIASLTRGAIEAEARAFLERASIPSQ
ncbi:hypothetical protein ACVNPS_00655 [Candidatus Bipolaricaulota sp. J31]